MKLPLTAVIVVMIANVAIAQERKIIGRVVDTETQKPLKNANIILKGTTSGTFTNQLGFFELAITDSEHKPIIASHIGYLTSEIVIPEQARFKLNSKKRTRDSRISNCRTILSTFQKYRLTHLQPLTQQTEALKS